MSIGGGASAVRGVLVEVEATFCGGLRACSEDSRSKYVRIVVSEFARAASCGERYGDIFRTRSRSSCAISASEVA